MPERPTGRVTFLMTDIEGSTQLLHQLGERYAVVLSDQRALVREAFGRCGGFEVDKQGDSFFYAFQSAPEALAGAVAAQRALIGHAWLDGIKLRVRMGLHTGEPSLAVTGYVGIDVHRAARVAAAAHGGQVVLTQATLDAAQGALPNGVSLRDLGSVRLKDFKQPEQLYQLAALDLPSNFPPIKGLDALDAHFETLIKALSESRVVIFLGEAVNQFGRGAGKTWQRGQAEVLPDASELAEHLARNFNYPASAPRDLLRVSEFVAVTTGTGPLYDELHKLLDADYPPNGLHHFLARLGATLREKNPTTRSLVIVTMNYDDALERALRAAGEPFDLVTYLAEGEARGKFLHISAEGALTVIERPNEYRGLAVDSRTVILKLHGAVDRERSEWDSFVVTEDDYIDYLARADISNLIPVTLAAKLRKSHFLFLGYSLRDWNLRVILHRLWGQQKLSYKSWAVGLKLDPLDQEFWRRRDVDTLQIRLEDYIGAFEEQVASHTSTGGNP